MILGVLLLAAFTASAEQWHKLSSPHFDVFTNAGERAGKATLQRMEQVRRVFVNVVNERGQPLPVSVYLFASTIGFLWLGTVPVTSGLIAQIFGVKYVSTLTGIAFLFHQVGSFFGAWLGGYLFDTTGSYQIMWTFTIALGVLAALINLPINDRPLVRPAAAAA